MGSGFAFVAQQKHFEVGDSDFYADLILYNIQLHTYVVVELKATPFKPEYMGQRGCVKIDTSSFLFFLYFVYHIIRYLLQLCC